MKWRVPLPARARFMASSSTGFWKNDPSSMARLMRTRSW